jgi:hypothetical protein
VFILEKKYALVIQCKKVVEPINELQNPSDYQLSGQQSDT